MELVLDAASLGGRSMPSLWAASLDLPDTAPKAAPKASTAAVSMDGGVSMDRSLGYRAFAARRASNALARGAVEIASLAGDEALWYPLPLILVAVHAVFNIWGNDGVATLAELFGDMGMLACIETALKATFRRARPDYGAAAPAFYVLPGEEYSFPSGHAMRSSFLAASLGLGRFVPIVGRALSDDPRAQALAAAAAVGVAASRVAKGRHYPTDVVAGALLGLFMAHGAALLGDAAWAALKVPCGIMMTLEALACLAVPRWRTQGFQIHVAIQTLWWVAQFYGRLEF
ncbi:phosphatidic acid phosphatase type 2/haloperoxidase [Pelagophyceae sp. CCMP2097]|nr:phosphatidic acid phosphatase type 2/haloperoxidase [Pelagophyceae sp. CCMP2097]